MNVLDIKIDAEFKELIPPLSSEEYAVLEDNIIVRGCRDALVLWGNILIDGHNRLGICQKHAITFDVKLEEFADRDEATLWIIENQLGRRNINAFVRGELVLKGKPLVAARAKLNQQGGQGGILLLLNSAKANTRYELAKLADVGHDNIRKIETIKAHGTPGLIAAVRLGGVSINSAHAAAKLPSEAQNAIVAEIAAGAEPSDAVKKIKGNIIRSARVEKITAISQGNAALGDVRYPVIYADPPWQYEHPISENRAIENHYPTMSIDEICALPVQNIANDDCVLFLWVTSPMLYNAMKVLDAWGFKYVSFQVWDKGSIGNGYYFRQQHETLLLAAKGHLPTPLPANRSSSVISEPRGKHSEKPLIVYDMIEKMFPEYSKIELFARQKRVGWSAWGNQS